MRSSVPGSDLPALLLPRTASWEEGLAHAGKLIIYQKVTFSYYLKLFFGNRPRTSMTTSSLVHQLYELLLNHCTLPENGRDIFRAKINHILVSTTLNASEDIDTVWRKTWDKIFYQNARAANASDHIDRLNELPAHPLAQFNNIPSDASFLKGLKHYTVKHKRLIELGHAWPSIYDLHASAARTISESLAHHSAEQIVDLARTTIGAPGYRERGAPLSLCSAIENLDGFAATTAFHICADLGYPVYKPDRWVVRFAATDPATKAALQSELPTGKSIKDITQAYLNRHPRLVMIALDHLTSAFTGQPQPADIVDLDIGFRRHRFVDLMVVKFGMMPERQFGLAVSPLTLLQENAALAARYPALHQIAATMHSS